MSVVDNMKPEEVEVDLDVCLTVGLDVSLEVDLKVGLDVGLEVGLKVDLEEGEEKVVILVEPLYLLDEACDVISVQKHNLALAITVAVVVDFLLGHCCCYW
jgi:hypothetical protein